MASRYPEELFERDTASSSSSDEQGKRSVDSSDYEGYLKDKIRRNEKGVEKLLEDETGRDKCGAMRYGEVPTDDDDAPSMFEEELAFLKEIHLAGEKVKSLVCAQNTTTPLTKMDFQQQRVRLIMLGMVQELLHNLPRSQPRKSLQPTIQKLKIQLSLLENVDEELCGELKGIQETKGVTDRIKKLFKK